MIPQIKKRKIGKIRIIDIQGDLVGPWAMKAKSEIHALLDHEQNNALVINLRGLHGIDSLGVKAITESLPMNRIAAFLNGSVSVMDMFRLNALPDDVRIFHSEEDLIHFFAKDLIAFDVQDDEEKRKHLRLFTALPVVFSCVDPVGREIQFRAIATNLSENGMFAEYINLEDVLRSQDFVNPYELKMLALIIKFPTREEIKVQGRVIRRKLDGEQVGIGIEFYQISVEDQENIKKFLVVSNQSSF